MSSFGPTTWVAALHNAYPEGNAERALGPVNCCARLIGGIALIRGDLANLVAALTGPPSSMAYPVSTRERTSMFSSAQLSHVEVNTIHTHK